MADTTNRIAGFASLTMDGVSYALAGEFTYQVSGSNVEVLSGQDSAFHGSKEMPFPGKVTFKGRDTGGLSQNQIEQIRNSAIVANLANGKTIIGRNMTRTGEPPKVSTEDATYEFELTGPSVTDS